ncbi:MAG: hypothetical protein U0528_10075 [Anaerolineae bacterium]
MLEEEYLRTEVPEVPEVPEEGDDEETSLWVDEGCSIEELERTAEADREAVDRDSYERYGDLLLNPETMMPYCPSEQWLREHPAEVAAAAAKAARQVQAQAQVETQMEAVVVEPVLEATPEAAEREFVAGIGAGSRMADFLALVRNGIMPSTTGRFRFTEAVEAIRGDPR